MSKSACDSLRPGQLNRLTAKITDHNPSMETVRELRLCPFCGGEAELQEEHNGLSYQYLVACSDDGCRGHTDLEDVHWEHKQDALNAWNTRPIEDRLQGEVDRLRGFNDGMNKLVDEIMDANSKLFALLSRENQQEWLRSVGVNVDDLVDKVKVMVDRTKKRLSAARAALESEGGDE